jgi:integrase
VSIKTAGGRKALKVDPDNIVFEKHATGQYVGYRKTADDDGTWWARIRVDGKQRYQALGDFAGIQPAKRYDAALAAAIEWFKLVLSGAPTEAITVADACKGYAEALARTSERKAQRARSDFRRLVDPDPIARIELSKLQPRHLSDWRERVESTPARIGRGERVKDTPKSPATINRDMVSLRAALRRALDRHEVASDMAWRVALRPIRKADKRRETDLSTADRRKLVEAASGPIAPFLRALAILPVRPGALAALVVADYTPRTRTLHVRVDKVGAGRRIVLPAAAAALFEAQCKDKLPNAPIFADAEGGHWSKDTWKKPIAAAARRAELPAAVTAYVVRHSVLSDMVAAGSDLFTIATLAGTSVQMLQDHYAHLRADRAEAALAQLAL